MIVIHAARLVCQDGTAKRLDIQLTWLCAHIVFTPNLRVDEAPSVVCDDCIVPCSRLTQFIEGAGVLRK